MHTIPMLPYDMIVNILSRLPVKPLIRFKCVCKLWNSLISDTHFAKIHLDKAIQDTTINRRRLLLSTSPFHSIDYEAASACDDEGAFELLDNTPWRTPFNSPVEFMGSCNGLVCLVLESGDFILWNPATRDAKELPKPIDVDEAAFNYGMGYVSTIDDYKLVRLASSTSESKTQIQIFSRNTNSWRKIQDIKPRLVLEGTGIFSNGALHWLLKKEIGQYSIISFDLVTENFLRGLVPLPDLDSRARSMHNFNVLGGCLSILYVDADNLELWAMKEFGVKDSWTKLAIISYDPLPYSEYHMVVLCFSKNDEVLMDIDGRELVLYNMKEATCRNLTIHDDWDMDETITYVESLVSPTRS